MLKWFNNTTGIISRETFRNVSITCDVIYSDNNLDSTIVKYYAFSIYLINFILIYSCHNLYLIIFLYYILKVFLSIKRCTNSSVGL